ncbi:MAG: hypothetical protein FJ096_12825 [Deltaproteobacteria bacterium]|nr:hypothetical protein [Deltaproteobacteria bacterium]
MSQNSRTGALVGGAALSIGACTSLLGTFETGGVGGSRGAMPSECETADDCDLGALDGDCASAACEDGACVVTPRPKGSECGEPGDRCDGDGFCVACLVDKDCDRGTCVEGACVEKALGETCLGAKECSSGFCSFGLCCDAACEGPCESCKLAGKEGSCEIAPLGTIGEPACAPYLCNGTSGACPATCTKNEECVAGRYCEPTAKTCELKKANGDVCANDTVCLTNECYQGSCCSTACVCGTCSTGQCVVTVSPGTDPQQECGSGTCNGLTGCSTEGALEFVTGAKLGLTGAAVARAVAVAPDGAIYVTGDYVGSVTFDDLQFPDALNGDAFVMKLAPNGKPVWVTRIAGNVPAAGLQSGKGIALGAKGNTVFVGGDFTTAVSLGPVKFTTTGSRNGFVATLSPTDGKILAGESIPASTSAGSVFVSDVDFDPASQELFVAGTFLGDLKLAKLNVAKGGADAYVARFDAKLALEAEVVFGGGGDDVVEAIAKNSQGILYAAGSFTSTSPAGVSFGGKSYVSSGQDDGFVASIDFGASPPKQQAFLSFGSTGSDQARDVAIGPTGGVHIVGKKLGAISFSGGLSGIPGTDDTSDPFVATYTDKLAFDWATTYPSATADLAEALAVDSKGFIAFGGSFASTLTFRTGVAVEGKTGSLEPFVASLVPGVNGSFEGFPLWAQAGTESLGIDEVTGIAATPQDRDVVVVGVYRGAMSFVGKSLPPTSDKTPSMFVARMKH